ncbi:unnamed protein product [Didymodactylos carnosus]|uniref:Integrase catalytic domain-containing protein n=2 Tax=Didymodactylos carnosus TaxID=1234261 RepID=A0A8S2F4D8_9BILA|nr:unnamed protein product [Didymodactylos carnosus]CAF4150890.1 unnamed protein product [Didymodactylos carnosus]
MYKDIRSYVQSCIKCAQHNPQRKKPPGELKSIPPPEGAWHLLTMDFHGPITPVSQRGNKYIISITDVLSKFVITKAVRDCSAQTATKFLKEDVIAKYGTLKCILTDNGTHFTANIMAKLLKKLGITHLLCTPYHPQSNGQIERYNSTMDAKIAALSNDRKNDWDEHLPFVTFNYNASIHSITGQLPFELMFGRPSVLPFDHQNPDISLAQDPERSQKLYKYLANLTDQAKSNIVQHQKIYKLRYDKNRSNPSYKVGQFVLIKVIGMRHKFDTRYEGPFQIIKQIVSKTFIVEHLKKPTLCRQVTVDVIILKLTNINAQCQLAAPTITQPQISNVTESTPSLIQPSPAAVFLILSTILQSTIDQYENISDDEEQKRPLTPIEYEDLSRDADIALPSPQPQFSNDISTPQLETPPQTSNTGTQERLLIMASDEDSQL